MDILIRLGMAVGWVLAILAILFTIASIPMLFSSDLDAAAPCAFWVVFVMFVVPLISWIITGDGTTIYDSIAYFLGGNLLN